MLRSSADGKALRSVLLALMIAIGALLTSSGGATAATFAIQQRITGDGGHGFGNGPEDASLSADGNTALIGDSETHSAHVFTRSGTTWNEQAVLPDPSNAENGWGNPVALSRDGSTAIVGSGINSGEATIFVRSGSTWARRASLGSPRTEIHNSDDFATSVALSADGSVALVGEPLDPPENQLGAAWLFVRSNGSWSPVGPVIKGAGEISSGCCILTKGRFGEAVALSANGSIGMVSAPLDNEGRGAVWVYEISSSGWTELAKFSAADEQGPQLFGSSLALSESGNVALVGGEGAVWVFERSGSSWVQRGSKITSPEDPTVNIKQFGWTLALSGDGNTAVTGAPGFGEWSGGAAWALRRSGTSWSQERLPYAAWEQTRTEQFGESLAASGDGTTLLVSAPGEQTHPPEAAGGAAWVFVGPPWTPLGSEGAIASSPLPGSAGVGSTGSAVAIAGFSESHRRWREGHALARISRLRRTPVGTTFSFTLNQPAAVTLVFAQRIPGRSVKGRCVSATRHSRHGRACRRRLVRGVLLFNGHAGVNQVAFQGRVTRRRWLPVGSYVTGLAAKSATGQRSATATLGFEIVR